MEELFVAKSKDDSAAPAPTQLKAIFDYLRAMAQRKACTTATACAAKAASL